MVRRSKNNLSKTITENFWAVWFLIVISLILIFTANQNALANFAWQRYHNIDLSLLLDKNNAALPMLIGNYYFNGVISGGDGEYDPDKAATAYRKAVSIDPGVLWGHYQLARIYFIEGNFDKAIDEINLELKYNTENLRSLYVRGLIFGYRGDLTNAEADFRQFTQWAPKEWAGYNDLAWILEKEGKYKEAEKTAHDGIKNALNGATNSWLWNSLGVARLNLEKYADAKISFEKAKTLAEKLTLSEWHRAYPGNDPSTSSGGLAAFKEAIAANIQAVEKYLR